MFERYKVVCVTPAGRRRYMQLLIPYIIGSPLVDEYHIWCNTTDKLDLCYLASLPTLSDKIRLIRPRTALTEGSPFSSIHQFFEQCVERDTIYLRFDDDIVFVEPDFFPKFLEFRVRNPDFFVVFPNIINNAICTYLYMNEGILAPGDLKQPNGKTFSAIHPWCTDATSWENPRFAEQLHRTFIKSVVDGNISRWYFGPQLAALCRFSVNCMAWFGAEFSQFAGKVPPLEEEYLSVIKPSQLRRANCIYGDAVVAHFAFFPQRAHLDSTDLLDQYASLQSSIRSGLTDNIEKLALANSRYR